ncbi:MAG: hypothetical protein IT212_07705 [Bacteroidia bacterium]|nr:hypothetical protein [Bacteroidia bacterium]
MEQTQIAPANYFTTILPTHSRAAIEECVNMAHTQLARDVNGKVKPHCATLEYVMPIEKLFCGKQTNHGSYKLTVNIFDSNEHMNSWIDSFEQDISVEVFYDRKRK